VLIIIIIAAATKLVVAVRIVEIKLGILALVLFVVVVVNLF